MSATAASGLSAARLAAILRGDETCSHSQSDALFDACAAEDILGLLYARVRHAPEAEQWPRDIVERLTRTTRENDARELLRQRELRIVLDALAAAGVRPILLKGTPLAYSIYRTPASRPRIDCDLLICCDDVSRAKQSMEALGYRATLQCEGELLFRQFVYAKTDAFGLEHVFDVHWKISTQSVFADVLTYDELAQEAVTVEALGPHARTTGRVHGLLLACIHPVMHHRNVERLIWVYDVHLLASQLSAADFDRFAELSSAKGMAAITAQQLGRARLRFATRFPDGVITRLTKPAAEPSASYLRVGRQWHHELSSNVRSLRSWRDRCRLFGEVVFPSSQYMLESYGISPGPFVRLIVPPLYLVRITVGIVKILLGRK
jgi:hypothetical protein